MKDVVSGYNLGHSLFVIFAYYILFTVACSFGY